MFAQANVSDMSRLIQRTEGGQSIRGPDGHRAGWQQEVSIRIS